MSLSSVTGQREWHRLAGKVQRRIVRMLADRFALWERFGIHVLPVHFYSPIPEVAKLPDATWSRRSELAGIDLREHDQLELLAGFERDYRAEYEAFPRDPTGDPLQYYVRNNFFGPVDGEILYCMLRRLEPRTVLEIGSGHSTRLIAQALARNSAEGSGEITHRVIDPHAERLLDELAGGHSSVLRQPVESVPLSTFEELGENDVLFIDSSHVLRIAGDVQFEYLEVLPRLKPGVVVHIHDIFFPYEYPRVWIEEARFFYTEQYLLQAMLAFSVRYDVLWCGSHFHDRHPDRLARAFSSYDPATIVPGSFWMRVRGDS